VAGAKGPSVEKYTHRGVTTLRSGYLINNDTPTRTKLNVTTYIIVVKHILLVQVANAHHLREIKEI
jgi:hypothetical protein